MATDAIVAQAGRAGVTLILKGSRSQKALAQGWDQLPDYGRLRHLTTDQIARIVDWCIRHNWLCIEYNRGIPLLVHSPQGWERVKMLWVARVLEWFAEWTAAEQLERVWPALEYTHRDIKFQILEVIGKEQRVELAPLLRTWFPHEVRAVREAINRTLQALGRPGLPHPKLRAERELLATELRQAATESTARAAALSDEEIEALIEEARETASREAVQNHTSNH